MMHQHNGQASERHAGPVEIGKKVGTKELLAVDQERHNAYQRSGRAHEERGSLPAADLRHDGIRGSHWVFSNAAR